MRVSESESQVRVRVLIDAWDSDERVLVVVRDSEQERVEVVEDNECIVRN